MAQGTAFKSIWSNAAYIFLIKLFPALASIGILILYSRRLPGEAYGSYQDFWVKLLLLGTLAYAGLPVTIITYSAAVIRSFVGSFRLKHYLLYGLWLVLCTAVFGWFSWELALPVYLSGGLILAYVAYAVGEALLMAARAMKGLLLLNVLYAVYFVTVHALALSGYRLEALLSWVLLGMAVRLALIALFAYAVYRRVPGTADHLPAFAAARRLWLHLGFYDLMLNVFRFLDKFILSFFLPAGVYAIYFNGSQTAEVPFLPYMLGAVASSVLIQLSDNKMPPGESYKLLKASGRILSCIVFPLFFFLYFFAEEILVFVLSDKYLDSVPIFLAAILVLPLRAFNYTTMLQHLHAGKVINKGVILDLFAALALMYPFHLLFGLPGIALSFVVSTYIQVGYYLWHTSRLIGIPVRSQLPLGNWAIKLVVFGSLFYLAHLLSGDNRADLERIIAGFCLLVLVSGGSLLLEIKGSRKGSFLKDHH